MMSDGPLPAVSVGVPEPGIVIFTLANQRHLNALTPRMSGDLGRLWQTFEESPEHRVAVLTGSGARAFSAGNDLTGTPPEDDPEWNFGGLQQLSAVTKPVIAAVNGLAVGGGLELALGCDIRIASAAATFASPEPRLGLLAAVGGTQRLPRIVGLGRALHLLLSADTIDAPTALAWGLVTAVAEPSELLASAVAVAGRIAALGPQALRVTKHLAGRAFDHELAAGLALERTASALVRYSPEATEGRAAFREKRAPQFATPPPGLPPGWPGSAG
jgi:enoyl-CoA hydratase